MNRGQRVCYIEERASVKTRRTEDRMVHLLTGKRSLTAWVQRDRWVYAGVRVAGWASQVALVVKNLSANAGDLRGVGSILEAGRPQG